MGGTAAKADTERVYQSALNEKVAFCPGAAFYTSQEQEVAAMRLNCSRPSEEALVKGLQVLGRLLNERERAGTPWLGPVVFGGARISARPCP
jgi:DNA-binding transcriptional MocR family regulator